MQHQSNNIRLPEVPICVINPHISGADTAGVLCVLKNPPSGKIPYVLRRVGFRAGGFGGYHQPLSSLYMLDSVCQTPYDVKSGRST